MERGRNCSFLGVLWEMACLQRWRLSGGLWGVRDALCGGALRAENQKVLGYTEACVSSMGLLEQNTTEQGA